METIELHAYIQGPDHGEVIGWIVSVVKDIQDKELVDLSEAIERVLWKFMGVDEELILEELVGSNLLELTIRVKGQGSVFSEWNNIKLGERLVDDLGGIALVDCGGVYSHPLSDQIVRVTRDKLELVMLPDMIGAPFDEGFTKLIKEEVGGGNQTSHVLGPRSSIKSPSPGPLLTPISSY